MSLVTLLITLVCSASLAQVWILILTARFCIIRKLRERNELLLIIAYLILSGVYPLGHLFMAWQRVEKYLNAKDHDQIYSLRYECLYEPAVILQNIGSWSISFTVPFTALCLIYVAIHPIEFFDVFDWHIALLPFGGTIACTTIAVVTEIWFMNYRNCENTRLSGLCFRIEVLGENFYRITQLLRISIFSLSFFSVIIAYMKARERIRSTVVKDWRFSQHTKRMFDTILKLGFTMCLSSVAIFIIEFVRSMSDDWFFIIYTIQADILRLFLTCTAISILFPELGWWWSERVSSAISTI